MNAPVPRSAAPSRAAGPAPSCAVHLIDKRTGAAHRVNGTPLVIFTRQPELAVAELLAGRDPDIWEARVDAIETGGAK